MRKDIIKITLPEEDKTLTFDDEKDVTVDILNVLGENGVSVNTALLILENAKKAVLRVTILNRNYSWLLQQKDGE